MDKSKSAVISLSAAYPAGSFLVNVNHVADFLSAAYPAESDLLDAFGPAQVLSAAYPAGSRLSLQ